MTDNKTSRKSRRAADAAAPAVEGEAPAVESVVEQAEAPAAEVVEVAEQTTEGEPDAPEATPAADTAELTGADAFNERLTKTTTLGEVTALVEEAKAAGFVLFHKALDKKVVSLAADKKGIKVKLEGEKDPRFAQPNRLHKYVAFRAA